MKVVDLFQDHLKMGTRQADSGGLRQAFITVQTTCHRKLMVYFAEKKSTTGFCFVSCYCIVVDDVNKQINWFPWKCPTLS